MAFMMMAITCIYTENDEHHTETSLQHSTYFWFYQAVQANKAKAAAQQCHVFFPTLGDTTKRTTSIAAKLTGLDPEFGIGVQVSWILDGI